MVQTQQEARKSTKKNKKFGRYDVKAEREIKWEAANYYCTSIVFGDKEINEISSRLRGNRSDKIKIFGSYNYVYTGISKLSESYDKYEIQDVLVDIGFDGNDFVVKINHKNPEKRQQTRKFLEEILN